MASVIVWVGVGARLLYVVLEVELPGAGLRDGGMMRQGKHRERLRRRIVRGLAPDDFF